jgi:hypothetical protein
MTQMIDPDLAFKAILGQGVRNGHNAGVIDQDIQGQGF